MLILGFLLLCLVYQLAEANGQAVLKVPGQPYSTVGLFMLVIAAADLMARWQGASDLAAYGLGLHPGWWQNYLLGVGLGCVAQALLEWVGVKLGIRHVAQVRFSLRRIVIGLGWILLANFPAAAAEDLITRGYIFPLIQSTRRLGFMLASALLYTGNHIIRLLIRLVTDWYHLPCLGMTLASALCLYGSIWYVMGLH